MNPHFVRQYDDYFNKVNIFFKRPSDAARLGRAFTGQMLCSDSDLEGSEYYNDSFRKFDVFHALGGTLRQSDTGIAVVSCLRSKQSGQFTKEETQALQCSVSHDHQDGGHWKFLSRHSERKALTVGVNRSWRYSFAIQRSHRNGNFTGTFLLNGPTPGSATGQRTITTGTQQGFFTVNCDGTGKITRVLTSSTGIVTSQIDDFVVTGAIEKGGRLIVTRFEDAVETTSALVPGSIFVTRVQTRVPPADQDSDKR